MEGSDMLGTEIIWGMLGFVNFMRLTSSWVFVTVKKLLLVVGCCYLGVIELNTGFCCKTRVSFGVCVRTLAILCAISSMPLWRDLCCMAGAVTASLNNREDLDLESC